MKAILDTNFLIYCAKQKIDYVDEIKMLINGKVDLVVTNQVINELKDLKENAKKYSDKEGANLALQLLKLNKIEEVKSIGKNADEGIINMNKGNYVATIDKELRDKIERPIVIRDKNQIGFA